MSSNFWLLIKINECIIQLKCSCVQEYEAVKNQQQQLLQISIYCSYVPAYCADRVFEIERLLVVVYSDYHHR